MSDGRSFTNYISSGIYDTYLENKFNISNDTSYRHYLQTHADEVMKLMNQVMTTTVRPPVSYKAPKLNAQGTNTFRDDQAPAFAPSQTMTPF
jgi:hypothetical protein